MEWHKQVEAVKKSKAASLAVGSGERSSHIQPDLSHFFNDIVLSYDDPLPPIAFVSQYLEVLDIDQDDDVAGSWSRTHNPKAD